MGAVTGKYSAFLFWLVLLLLKFVFIFSWSISVFLSFTIYLSTGGWRYFRVCVKTLRRDLFGLSVLVRIHFLLFMIGRRGHGIREHFTSVVNRRGRSSVAAIHNVYSLTFGEIDDRSNQIAHYLHECGLQQKDNIALFMEAEPNYIAFWLGAAKMGIATGLINSNLRRNSLISSITQLSPKAIIVGASMTKAITEAGIAGTLPIEDLIIFHSTFCSKIKNAENMFISYRRIKEIFKKYPTTVAPPLRIPSKLNDRLIYVYTSGTTGLPKAAIISFTRYVFMCSAITFFTRIRDKDVVYTPLPLYHTAGCIIGCGQLLIHGVTQVIRTRFSASNFWSDCVRHKCTVIQYVGETCRYLLCQPRVKEEVDHRVRLAIGNGLRRQVWAEFVTRFKIEQVGEFYGATESNANLCNSENKLGAVGFSSMIIPPAYPVYLIKVDLDSGEVVRDLRGFCQACQPGEVGQLIGRITRTSASPNFDGYINRSETSSKIISNVFSSGDRWYQTGDLMVQDDDGFYYFVDRLGDTFRWRGENVSTTEVENITTKTINFADCIVYGVDVPENDGKAGMLMIALNYGNFSAGERHLVEEQVLSDLFDAFNAELPRYAIPLFIRFSRKIDTTDTFKFRKVFVSKEGFDPSKITDCIYYLTKQERKYKKLDDNIFRKILRNELRF